MNRLIELVVRRIGLDVADQLQANARKVKFIVSEVPPDSAFPVKFTDFEVSPARHRPLDLEGEMSKLSKQKKDI